MSSHSIKKRNELQIEMVDYNAQVSSTTESLPSAQSEGVFSDSRSEYNKASMRFGSETKSGRWVKLQ